MCSATPLLNVARENAKVVVLDGDLGNSTKAETVRKNFPERFFNIGIAESNLVGIGAGLAGLRLHPLDYQLLFFFTLQRLRSNSAGSRHVEHQCQNFGQPWRHHPGERWAHPNGYRGFGPAWAVFPHSSF